MFSRSRNKLTLLDDVIQLVELKTVTVRRDVVIQR